MKALVYTAPNEVTFREEPAPSYAVRDVQAAVHAMTRAAGRRSASTHAAAPNPA